MSQAPPPRSTAFHSLLHLPRRIRRTLCSRYYDDSVFSSLGSRNPSGRNSMHIALSSLVRRYVFLQFAPAANSAIHDPLISRATIASSISSGTAASGPRATASRQDPAGSLGRTGMRTESFSSDASPQAVGELPPAACGGLPNAAGALRDRPPGHDTAAAARDPPPGRRTVEPLRDSHPSRQAAGPMEREGRGSAGRIARRKGRPATRPR